MARRKKDRKGIRLKRIAHQHNIIKEEIPYKEIDEIVQNTSAQEIPTEKQLVYSNVKALIDMYPTPGSAYLSHLLESDIKNYGEENVTKALSQLPDEYLSVIQDVIHYEEDSGKIHHALKEFADAILGEIPDEEKAKVQGEIMDML